MMIGDSGVPSAPVVTTRFTPAMLVVLNRFFASKNSSRRCADTSGTNRE
jgi:hypothetical protein